MAALLMVDDRSHAPGNGFGAVGVFLVITPIIPLGALTKEFE